MPAPYTNKRIASIDFLKNPILEKRFEAKRIEFKRHNFPDDVVFAFHGTKPENVDSIAKENLTIIRRAAHGGGYYFSEYPEISFGIMIMPKINSTNFYQTVLDRVIAPIYYF